MNTLKLDWNLWLSHVWKLLTPGVQVRVPTWLHHPAAVGFTRQSIAEDVGQLENYVLSVSDGSRLHIHVFDGHMLMHRDAIDPKGFWATIAHILTETRTGALLKLVGLGVMAGATMAALSSSK